MTEAEWLVCNDPAIMFDRNQWAARPYPFLSGADAPYPFTSERKLRLFVAALYDASTHNYFDWFTQNVLLAAWRKGERAEREGGTIQEEIATWLDPRSDNPGDPPAAVRAAMLRDIFGNPFRPVYSWTYSSSAAVLTAASIAQAIYDERAFDRMPILADALEESGATNQDILNHCRQESIHVRGCWVIDLLLGKE